MKYTKDGVIQDIAPDKVNKYVSAGWTLVVDKEEKAEDEVIRLKPPVKLKATVKVLEEANNKGDE